jgi:ribulose-5-phosphate 4-epimerase/fuculose-1-phosphate aldolase
VLRNHGLLVCAPRISTAFKEMYAMEKSCKTQLAVMATGAATIPMSEDLLEFTSRQFERDATPTAAKPDGWESLKKMLDRVNPGYDN